MTFTVRVPRAVVFAVLLLSAVGVALVAVTLFLPTPLKGYLNGRPVHQSVSTIQYLATGAVAAVAVTLLWRLFTADRHEGAGTAAGI